MKNDPSIPPRIPKIIAAGISLVTFTVCFVVKSPNLTYAPDQSSKLPFTIPSNIAITNVPQQHEKNTLQIIWNFQNVFGVDNSYIKRAPPIGAPNATLTPAEDPAAINILLDSSF